MKTTNNTNIKSYIINSNNKDVNKDMSKLSESSSLIKVNCICNKKDENKNGKKINDINNNNNNNININEVKKEIKNEINKIKNKKLEMDIDINNKFIFNNKNNDIKHEKDKKIVYEDKENNDKENGINKNNINEIMNEINEEDKNKIDKEKNNEKDGLNKVHIVINKENEEIKQNRIIDNKKENNVDDINESGKENKIINNIEENKSKNFENNNKEINKELELHLTESIQDNSNVNNNTHRNNLNLNTDNNNDDEEEIKEEINNYEDENNNNNNINEESNKNNDINNIYNKKSDEIQNISTNIKPQESDNYYNHIITTDFEKDKNKDKNINKEEDKKLNEENNINSNDINIIKNNDDYANRNNYDYYPELLCNINDNSEKEEEKSILTTQSRDCLYYQNELEKLSTYIKKYYSEKNSYPQSGIEFYLFGREIGHGAFGKVNLCLHIASGHLVAMKTFIKKDLKYKETKDKLKNEVEVLSKLHHPFINQILDSFETETHFFIVMEYVCGDLLSFIRKRNKLNEPSAKIIFKQIIEGLKYIHKKKIIHRDIKLDNILIDLNNTIKICDFGVSRKIEKGNLIYERCGTPAYIAPEIYSKIGYEDGKCDIWSAGITLYYMLSGNLPFKGSNIQELEKVILSGEYEKIKDVSNEANNIIDGMLRIDPNNRLTIDEILKHPWLNNTKLENRYKLNIFTEAEKNLLCKYDVDYLNSSKSDLIENFTYRNLALDNNKKKIGGNTKSIIYAPYNSCVNEDSKDEEEINIISYLNKEEKALYEELEINNNICKFGWRVKQANINYELSNNDDFDNGLMKSIKEEEYKNKNEKIDNENNSAKNKSLESVKDYEKIKIDKKILEYIEKNVGYDKKYLTKCLKKNIINYSTATYYLLYKDKMNKKS